MSERLCDFNPVDDRDVTQWKCIQCGFVTKTETRKGPKRYCSETQSRERIVCPHRITAKAVIGKPYGSCSPIQFHQCSIFGELVQIRRHGDQDKLKVDYPAFSGRTCRECKVLSQERGITILHITFRPGWQDQIRRCRFALGQHGVSVHGLEIVRPSRKTLVAAIVQHRPDMVINHGFCLRHSDFLPVVESHRSVKFVTVDHSNQNHTLTWPQYFTDEKATLAATQRLRNLWYASPDAYGPWRELGYERYLHWPNPICLPDSAAPTAPHNPPVLAIVGRADWMKAFPVQVAAAAIVQRRRPLRVAFVFRDAEERQRGLREHARACGLEFETQPWGDMQTWERWLRDECDVVSQSTFSDSFNYVSLDAAAFGKPFIGSWAIRHTPPEWRVDNPNDTFEVAARIEWILDNYPAASAAARSLAERVAGENNAAYARLVAGLIGSS